MVKDTGYFHGHTADQPHPYMAATGTEGRCELCGKGPDAPLHQAHEKPITPPVTK